MAARSRLSTSPGPVRGTLPATRVTPPGRDFGNLLRVDELCTRAGRLGLFNRKVLSHGGAGTGDPPAVALKDGRSPMMSNVSRFGPLLLLGEREQPDDADEVEHEDGNAIQPQACMLSGRPEEQTGHVHDGE